MKMKLVSQGIASYVFKEKKTHTNGLRDKEIKQSVFQEIKTWGMIKCKSVLSNHEVQCTADRRLRDVQNWRDPRLRVC